MIFQQQSWINIWSIIYVTNLFNSVISEYCNKRESTLAVTQKRKFLKRGECFVQVVKLRNLLNLPASPWTRPKVRKNPSTGSVPMANKTPSSCLGSKCHINRELEGGRSPSMRVRWAFIETLPSMDGKGDEGNQKLPQNYFFPRNYLRGMKKK